MLTAEDRQALAQIIGAARATRDARTADIINKLVADAPPLTEDQRARIALLLASPTPPPTQKDRPS